MAEKIWHIRMQVSPFTVFRIDRSPTILGRGADCDIIIGDSTVSTQHVQFNTEGKALTIHDLKSSNGTALDGKAITQVRIKPLFTTQHEITIGEVSFKLYLAEPKEEPARKLGQQDDVSEWFFSANGVDHGPLSLREVYDAVDRRELKPTDDFWQKGSNYKVKAFEVEGLFDSDDEAPPGVLGTSSLTQGSVQCPYCWQRFNPEDVLFIAGHPDLLGDPVLGADQPQRFLPTRFTAEGLALDARGVVCPDMSCPTCHMRIPTALLDSKPFIVSIVGAPGSGKSYFLASAVWSLRTTLPRRFNVRFMDVDATTNQWLNDYEEKLFFQSDGDSYQTIAKTDLTAPTVYKQVLLSGMPVSLPLPSLFSMDARAGIVGQPEGPSQQTLVLYDNAGEHFQAGADSAGTPVTKHLVHAEGILFLFDPTEDPRFRHELRDARGESARTAKMHRQDVLLVEMVSRIRKYLGLGAGERLRKTIVVGISKADLLAHILPLHLDPWRTLPNSSDHVLDLDLIERMSRETRSLIDKFAPEIVTTVESFAETVLYMPNSALGHNPSTKGVRPTDISPRWVEVPFLYMLSKCGYIRTATEPNATS